MKMEKRCREAQRHREKKGREERSGKARERPSPGASRIFWIFQETGGFLFLTTTSTFKRGSL